MEMHAKIAQFLFTVLMNEASDKAKKTIFKETIIFDCNGMGMHQFSLPGTAPNF
jgi:hypothetical protein